MKSLSTSPDGAHGVTRPTTELEIVSANPAESKALLEKVGARIEQHAQFLQRGERINDGWRVVIGLELTLAKPHLDHGQFIPFMAKVLPGYDRRTALLWMEFAEVVITKCDQRSHLKLLPEKVQNGGVSETELPSIVDDLEKLTGGKSFREFMADPASRKIDFHCPHCGHENRGFPGRTLKCGASAQAQGKEEGCGKKITVQEDKPTAGDKVAEMIAAEKEVAEDLIAKLEQWRARQHRSEAGRELLLQLSAALVEANKETKALLKAQRAKKVLAHGHKKKEGK